MKIVRLNRPGHEYVGCYGVVLDEEGGYATVLLLRDGHGELLCRTAYRIPADAMYVCRVREELGIDGHPDLLWDCNVQFVTSDIAQLVEDGRRFREMRRLMNRKA